MDGKDIFKNIINDRDYTGSVKDSYSQLIMTIYSNIGDSIFELLVKAEKENKILDIKKESEFNEEFNISDIELIDI